MTIDYLALIDKYFPADASKARRIMVVHAVLVTNKALAIARRLDLTATQLVFIEEAAMLHDLGVGQVDSPKMDCHGSLPYIAHGVAGAQLLRQEGLMAHARVAERHVGVGLTKREIKVRGLPLPAQDFVPETDEEQIITYADLFFSKREESLWQEASGEEIIAELQQYGEEQVKIFVDWQRRFDEGA